MGAKSTRGRRTTDLSFGDGTGGGVDLISGLSDDLLVRILELLPDARDVVRTHTLSRRWRGLWTGVAALRRFDYNSRPNKFLGADDGAAERYVAFVNDALALRAAAKESAVKDLAISFDMLYEPKAEGLAPPFVQAAQGWIRYGLQHVAKSVSFRLDLPWLYLD